MSFLINWDLLKDGQEALELKRFLNERFESIERPNFLGPISVEMLDFGNIPPEISIVNICDPLEEFYYFESTESLENRSSQENNSFDSTFSPTFSSNENQDYSTFMAKKDENDFQIEVSICYKGNFRMTMRTELIINQPTENFMVLPLNLTLTKTSLDATAIFAYMGNKVINFCLREPLDRSSVLKDMTIESEVGDASKQVLKNIGKIEKFIVASLSKFLEDYIVFPNYHSLFLEQDDL